jgi:hypothetical protein
MSEEAGPRDPPSILYFEHLIVNPFVTSIIERYAIRWDTDQRMKA